MFRSQKLLLFLNRALYIASAAMLIAGLALSVSSYQASATNTSVYCANGNGWVFVYPLTPPTVTYTAPEGYQITEYCIGNGEVLPTYADNDPPTTSLTLNVPIGAHPNASFQIELIGDPPEPPTEEPTDVPTELPTEVPTDIPTEVPTEEPTIAPTSEPTDEPTDLPTDLPTEEPTEVPTDAPTEEPTDLPTLDPTEDPTQEGGYHQVDPPLPQPDRSVVSAAVLIPVTGMPVTPGMHPLTFGGMGILGIALVLQGIRKKKDQ
jgi:hypothetical protein